MTSYKTIFVDLDQTIYPPSSGLWDSVASRINLFLQDQLDIGPEEATELRLYYYQRYGTTLRGLQKEAKVDPIRYMDFIHDVPIEAKIQPDPELRTLFQSVEIPKYIFTNASVKHAERVLKHLNLEDCFNGIIDIISLDFINKPDPTAYQRALEIAGEPPTDACILLDDSLKNLKTGSKLGMTTIHVGSFRDADFIPDFHILTIHALLDVLPELRNSQPPRELLDE